MQPNLFRIKATNVFEREKLRAYHFHKLCLKKLKQDLHKMRSQDDIARWDGSQDGMPQNKGVARGGGDTLVKSLGVLSPLPWRTQMNTNVGLIITEQNV